MKYEQELKTFYTIRFNDCDPFNHLNNSSYFDYMLNAREDHLKEYYNRSMKDFYLQGFAWVIGTHEIIYIRPASYGEKVCIYTALIEATKEYLLAEMIMTDESGKKIKAVLWTKFTCVNIQTQKKQNHSEEFMEFAKSIEVKNVNVAEGLKSRVSTIRL